MIAEPAAGTRIVVRQPAAGTVANRARGRGRINYHCGECHERLVDGFEVGQAETENFVFWCFVCGA